MLPSPDHAGDAPPPMPRWVKMFIGIIVAVLVTLVLLKIFAGGGHGPRRHLGSIDTGQVQSQR
jgi:hypothetical protein